MGKMPATTKRLASLDILRGFDLFMLVFLQPVLVEIARVANIPWLNAVMYQLDHEVWEGFRAWDLVMPLFLFMVGTSMPFSFAKYRGGTDRKPLYKRILRRFLLLFLFGMIVQGNLLALDADKILIYNNTLQSIAVGYLIAAMLMLHCTVRAQIGITAAMLIVYWLPMHFCGDYTLEGSFAYKVDEIVLGRFRGDLSYTWIWSSLTFGVTVMLGSFAGQIIRSVGKLKAAGILAVTGVTLIGAGLLWSLEMPIIKRLWTSSMTLFSGGLCFLLLAAFYFVIDCVGFSFGLNWLKIYGMNPITAYVLGEVVNFRSIVSSLTYGLQQYLGDYWTAWLTFGNFLILFFILYAMYRRRVFLRL